jgi:hypothetical protein
MTGMYRLTQAAIALIDEGDSLKPVHLESSTVVEIVGQRTLLPPAAASNSGTAMTMPIALHTV